MVGPPRSQSAVRSLLPDILVTGNISMWAMVSANVDFPVALGPINMTGSHFEPSVPARSDPTALISSCPAGIYPAVLGTRHLHFVEGFLLVCPKIQNFFEKTAWKAVPIKIISTTSWCQFNCFFFMFFFFLLRLFLLCHLKCRVIENHQDDLIHCRVISIAASVIWGASTMVFHGCRVRLFVPL